MTGRLPDLDQVALALRDVDAGDHAGDIDDSDEGSAGDGHFAFIDRAIGNHAAPGAVDLGVTELGVGREQLGLSGLHLGARGGNLIPLADRVESAEVFLSGLQLRFRRSKLYAGLIHTAAGERALAEQFGLAVEELLGSDELLRVGFDICLGFDHGFGDGSHFHGVEVQLSLADLALGIGDSRGQVAAFQNCEQLALLHVVATIGVELEHRLGDVGHHAGLVLGVEDAVAGNDVTDGLLRYGGDLDGRGRLGLAFFFLGTARGGKQAGGQGGKQPSILHRLKGPRQCLKIGGRDAQADESVVDGVASVAEGRLGIDHFQDGNFTGLVAEQGQIQTLFGEIERMAQRCELIARQAGFAVEAVERREQLALGEAEIVPGLLQLEFGLLDAAAGGAPGP